MYDYYRQWEGHGEFRYGVFNLLLLGSMITTLRIRILQELKVVYSAGSKRSKFTEFNIKLYLKLEMSGNVIFNPSIPPVPNCSFPLPFKLPGLVRWHSHFLLSPVEVFWYQKQLKIKLQIQMSKLGHFSQIPIFLPIVQ